MSVRVNLLPEATKQRDRAGRQRFLAAAGGAAVLMMLGGVWLWQGAQLNDANDRLAVEEQRVAVVNSEIADLAAFRDLQVNEQRIAESVQAALAWEVSLAAVLQDVAASIPEDAQLDSLNVAVSPEPEVDPISGQRSAGTFTLSASSLTDHAPGLERFLLSLDQYVSLFDLHVSSSTLETEREDNLPVVAFTVEGRISDTLRTETYANGLPEVLR